jgi:hypothetical protein
MEAQTYAFRTLHCIACSSVQVTLPHDEPLAACSVGGCTLWCSSFSPPLVHAVCMATRTRCTCSRKPDALSTQTPSMPYSRERLTCLLGRQPTRREDQNDASPETTGTSTWNYGWILGCWRYSSALGVAMLACCFMRRAYMNLYASLMNVIALRQRLFMCTLLPLLRTTLPPSDVVVVPAYRTSFPYIATLQGPLDVSSPGSCDHIDACDAFAFQCPASWLRHLYPWTHLGTAYRRCEAMLTTLLNGTTYYKCEEVDVSERQARASF